MWKKCKNINFARLVKVVETLAGVLMIGIGLYKIYPPAMFLGIGVILAFPGLPGKSGKKVE